MAVVTVASTAIANHYAVPRTRTSSGIHQDTPKTTKFVVSVTSGDSIGSIYRLARLPAKAVVHSLRIFHASITSAAADFGLYVPTQTALAGDVVDADFFASAVSLATGQVVGTEIAFEAAGAHAISAIQQSLAVGLNVSEKGQEYELCATLTAAAAADGILAGFISFTE